MAFEKIENSDLIGKLIAELADVPELTADELKQRFDAASKDVIIPKFNKLIDALIAVSAASFIGMEVPEGITAEQNIAAIITALAVSVKSNSESSHTHSNKVSLDAITADVKEKYDNLVTLFSAIKTISDVVKDDSTLLPTGKAIVDYVKKLGGGDMLKATYDPDDDGVVDNASKLGGQVPEYYQKSTENTLETDDKTVTGAINEVYGMAQNGGKNLIGEDFSPEKNYTVGKHVINGNNRYRFIVDHPAGPWDASHVEELLVDEEMDELNENNAIETLSYDSNVSNYFMQFYKQGNHVWGSAYTNGTVFSDKTMIKFSADNFNGSMDALLRLFCKLPGNIFALNDNVQHIVGVGAYRFENASSTLYVYTLPIVAVYNGTDTEILVPFTGLSNPKDVRYEFVIDAVL